MSSQVTKPHEVNQFGIIYPSNIRGVGSPSDLLAFLDAVRLVSDDVEAEFPFVSALRRKPVWGKDMLKLFGEAKQLQFAFSDIKVTNAVLSRLGLLDRNTKLKIEKQTLSGVFSKVFEILTERAPGFIQAASEYPGDKTLETGSVRLGPIEPLIASSLFKKLPASAFDDADPPLWLRDEIFDEAFYQGKI